jgi:hypothetical protein
MDRTVVIAIGVALILSVLVGVEVYQETIEVANQCNPDCEWIGV